MLCFTVLAAGDVEVQPELAFERPQARGPEHEEPEEDHDPAADHVEFKAPSQQRLSERRGRGSKGDEDRREAQHEAEAQPDRRGAALRAARRRSSRDVGDIAGHQRQDAGRQKGDGAGQQRGEKAERLDVSHG